MKKLYSQIRSLHLYFGLFISPFVLIFAVSVLVFNHPATFGDLLSVKPLPVTKKKLDAIPYDTTDLLTAKAIMGKLGLKGEIDFVSQNEDEMSFPARMPGYGLRITVNKHSDSVYIQQHVDGSLRGTAYLHSMPGPHVEKIRGNSGFMKFWRILADVVVYVLLFLSASGILLWYFLKVERNLGLFSLAVGALVFSVLLLLVL